MRFSAIARSVMISAFDALDDTGDEEGFSAIARSVMISAKLLVENSLFAKMFQCYSS